MQSVLARALGSSVTVRPVSAAVARQLGVPASRLFSTNAQQTSDPMSKHHFWMLDQNFDWKPTGTVEKPAPANPLTPFLLGVSAYTLAPYFIVDEEVFVIVGFASMVKIVSMLAGPGLKKSISNAKKTWMWQYEHSRQVTLDQLSSISKALEFRKSLPEDLQSLNSYTAETLAKVRDAKKRLIQHTLRAEVVRSLSLIQKFEEGKLREVQSRIVDDVTNKVRSAFLPGGDAAAQTQALNLAIEALGNLESKPSQKDPVQSLFAKHLDAAKKEAAKATKPGELSPEEEEIVSVFVDQITRRHATAVAEAAKQH